MDYTNIKKVSYVAMSGKFREAKGDKEATVKDGRKVVFLWNNDKSGQSLFDFVRGDVAECERLRDYIKDFGRDCDAVWAANEVSALIGVPVAEKVSEHLTEMIAEHEKWADVLARRNAFNATEAGKEHNALARMVKASEKLEKFASCDEVKKFAGKALSTSKSYFAVTGGEVNEDATNCDDIVTVAEALKMIAEARAARAAKKAA